MVIVMHSPEIKSAGNGSISDRTIMNDQPIEALVQELNELRDFIKKNLEENTINENKISSNSLNYRLFTLEQKLAPTLTRIKSRLQPTVKQRKSTESLRSLAEFNNFNYWKLPLPELTDEMLREYVQDFSSFVPVYYNDYQAKNPQVPLFEMDDIVKALNRLELLVLALRKDAQQTTQTESNNMIRHDPVVQKHVIVHHPVIVPPPPVVVLVQQPPVHVILPAPLPVVVPADIQPKNDHVHPSEPSLKTNTFAQIPITQSKPLVSNSTPFVQPLTHASSIQNYHINMIDTSCHVYNVTPTTASTQKWMNDEMKETKNQAKSSCKTLPNKSSAATILVQEETCNEIDFDKALDLAVPPKLDKVQEILRGDTPRHAVFDDKPKGFFRRVATLFKWLNLARCCALAIYGTWFSKMCLASQTQYQNFTSFWIATVVFLWIEFLVSLIKALPGAFWCCWNVKGWNPLDRKWTIFALIADHDLLTDLIPCFINLALKIYSFRFEEISNGQDLEWLSIDANANGISIRYHNTTLLSLFVASITFMLMNHCFQLVTRLIREKGAYMLSWLIILKTCLLGLDMASSSLLLYYSLVGLGTDLFVGNVQTRLVISVISVSSVVVSMTNIVVNIPLHYYFLKMKLHGKIDKKSKIRGDDIGFFKLVNAAINNATHPLLSSLFGLYQVYAMVVVIYVLKNVNGYDWLNSFLNAELPNTNVQGWQLLVLFWINLIVNYLPGILFTGYYWIKIIVKGLFAIKK